MGRMLMALFICLVMQKGVAAPVATLDRSLWPDSLASHPGFNAASRREILNFASELLSSELISPDEWPARLALPQVDMLAIDRYRTQTWLRLLASYQAASRECHNCPHPNSVAQLRELVMQPHPVSAQLEPWLADSRQFHARYLLEQLTLAAQISERSSAVATLSAGGVAGF